MNTPRLVAKAIIPVLAGTIAFSSQAQVAISEFTSLPDGLEGWDILNAPTGINAFRKITGQVIQIRDTRNPITTAAPGDISNWGFASYALNLDLTYFNQTSHPGYLNDLISIKARQVTGNSSDLTFGLVDANSTLKVWSIPAATFGAPGGAIKNVEVAITAGVEFGTHAFDLSKVTELQIYRNTANFNPDTFSLYTGSTDTSGLPASASGTSFAWQFDSMTAVPEPHQYALLAGLGLIGFAGYRRLTQKTA